MNVFRQWTILMIASVCVPQALGQSTLRLDELPHYDRFQAVGTLQREFASQGRVSQGSWAEDASEYRFQVDGQKKKIQLADKKIVDADEAEAPRQRPATGRQRRGGRVGRAQQRTTEPSPDGNWNAVYRDFNVWLEPTSENKDKKAIQVTQGGEERHRFGTCCWVYGEELDQQEAMWWSPDSHKLVYYEVDESEMKDYHLTLDNMAMYTTLKSVRYPKAGDPNPKVSLWIYDLESKSTERIAIEGEPSQYLYGIEFSPNGERLLVHRTNRRQDVLDWLSVDIKDLRVATVVTEKQSTWQSNAPRVRFLSDGERFLWETEKSGWKRFELRHVDGRLLSSVCPEVNYPCVEVVKIDEEAGWVYYSACSDENPYNVQLHRARLDGSKANRITSASLNHSAFDISPDHRFVVTVRERFDALPETVVYDMEGNEIAILAKADHAKADAMELPAPEMFSFMANDGKTRIYGTLNKPSHFDPNVKYPLLIDVYGGPSSMGISNRYSVGASACEFGFVVAKIGNRGTVGRGKAFESATYMHLGIADLDDQAEGVRYLSQLPYIDGKRVGIFGHSYGGYMSALSVLRYPELFRVAVAGAPVTDWRNYDTIYTERYMQTPQENPKGYDEAACMHYADRLQGHLLLVHGLVDDNVHPSNTWQLANALHTKNRRFEMMIYPEFDHGVGSTYGSLRWEYLYRNLQP